VRRVSGFQEVALGGVAEREIEVLAASIHSAEGFLGEEGCQAVSFGDGAKGLHDQLLVVGREVAGLIDRSEFVLGRGHFVVAGLDGDAEFEEFALTFHHVSENALGDHTEVLVFEFLALRGFRAEERAACVEQVGTCVEEVAVDEEIFLLGSRGAGDVGDLFVAEEAQDALGLCVEGLHGAEQRGLVVKHFPGPGDERGRDAKRAAVRVFEDVSRAGHVPDGVTAGFEGRTDAAARKAGGVRFALDKRLAGELGDRAANAVGREEGVVLLGGEAGERVEDVRIVRRTFFDGPVFHRRRDDIGHGSVEFRSAFDRFEKAFVDVLGQAVFHFRRAEHVGAVQISRKHIAEIRRRGRFEIGDGVDCLESGDACAHG